MRVIETFQRSKSGSEDDCEDRFVQTDAFVGVVDGATDKSGRSYGGTTSGRFAARVVAETFELLDPDIEAGAAVENLTERLAEATALEAAGDHPDRPSATFAVISIARREIWRVGGDTIRVDGASSSPMKATEAAAARARAMYLRLLVAAGAEVDDLRANDPGRALVLPILELEHRFRNSDLPDGYGAIDGSPVPRRFIEVRRLQADSPVILATDGYPSVADTLRATEQELATSLARDPLRIGEPPATKGVPPGGASFDDRTYVRVR